MAKYVIDESTLTGIANSIRAKKGTSDIIKPEKMPEEIASIEGGGGGSTPEYPNGMYVTNDASLFDMVVFGKTFANQFKQYDYINSVTYDEGITSIASENCYYSTVKRVVFPTTLESIGTSSFEYCSKLEFVGLADGTQRLPDGIKTIGRKAFYQCGALAYLELPDSVETIGESAFAYCGNLVIPKIYAKTLGQGAFTKCTSLVVADMINATSLNSSAFYNCSNLRALVLRSSTFCSIGSTLSLASTPIASGTGYIYVPSALIEQYKNATNWAKFADQFRALEDYTIDGTATGELDLTKI